MKLYPAETAPKDGSWFLVICPDSPMCWAPYEFACWQKPNEEGVYYALDGEFYPNENGYFCGTDTSDEISFTHWAPLPKIDHL